MQARAFREFESLSRCCLCAASDIRAHLPPDVWICRRCGVLFRNPRPTQSGILDSYNAGLRYAAWQRESTVRAHLWQKRLALLLRHKTCGRLLDVGTGDGFFLDIARGAFSVEATEASETGARYARARGHSPLVGPLSRIALPERMFDVVTLWHVLEHLPDPGPALTRLRHCLKPDGILAIAVPNETLPLLRHRFLRRERDAPLGKLTWGEELHLTHFTPRVLLRFLRESGFVVREQGVDDVDVERTPAAVWSDRANRVLNALTGRHLGKAFYVVCEVAHR